MLHVLRSSIARVHVLCLSGLLTATLAPALLLGANPAAAASPAPAGASWVRAAHLVPELPAMSVTLRPADGAAGSSIVLSSGLAYGTPTEYRPIAPGSYSVTLRPVSAGTDDAPALASTFTAVAGKAVSLAALGSAAEPRLAVLQDDLTPPSAGQARVRVLPAASAADQVSVQAVDGPVLTPNGVFGQPTPYASVPAGTWELAVASPQGAAGTGSVTLEDRAVYTVLVVDGPSGELQLTPLIDAEGVAVLPTGGVQTGGGGTAPGVSSAFLPGDALVAAAVPVVLGLLVLVSRRRRAGGV